MKVFKDGGFSRACADGVSYGFYGREGGVSSGIYASLNCAWGSNDDPECVRENRSIVARNLSSSLPDISTPWQCHTPDCVIIDTALVSQSERPEADAFVTDKIGVAIGILTADCGPVLFAGKKANGENVVGAAHAGWGGALKGVLENTVAAMVQIGAEPESITACVGPCIAAASYEVQEAFAQPFVIQHEGAEHFFKSARKTGHLMFDLPGYIAYRLSMVGVKGCVLMGHDTYGDEAGFFSYRRATHRGEADYGRQMSAIVINS